MYSYHNRIRQRINNGELIGYHFADDYPNIGEALVLEFSTFPPVRPSRPHMWEKYVDILADWNKEKSGPREAPRKTACKKGQ